ncbi:ankyrin repeat domain-containing protein [Legionella gresilensis]|uniref:ankyrin repeat domain-containing protein n=1 Tax=Legionella gresilensis TaxID=91823 RepID=UPI0010410B10|nr:ankyrin repeat domain-containing protein [Legionella gresilensis]
MPLTRDIVQATKRGGIETVQAYLQAGNDVNEQDREGRTLLFSAVKKVRKIW